VPIRSGQWPLSISWSVESVNMRFLPLLYGLPVDGFSLAASPSRFCCLSLFVTSPAQVSIFFFPLSFFSRASFFAAKVLLGSPAIAALRCGHPCPLSHVLVPLGLSFDSHLCVRPQDRYVIFCLFTLPNAVLMTLDPPPFPLLSFPTLSVPDLRRYLVATGTDST